MLSVGMSRVLKEILLSRGEVFYLDVLTLFLLQNVCPTVTHFVTSTARCSFMKPTNPIFSTGLCSCHRFDL